MQLLVFFIGLNIINVIIQTIKSLVTVKGGKMTAAAVNALTYGVYTIVLVYMNCDLPLWIKILTVSGANLVGVYFVKWLEEKTEKFKLYKIEITVTDNAICEEVLQTLKELNISSNTSYFTNVRTQNVNNIINTFCYSKKEREQILTLVKKYGLKYFVNISR